MKWRLLRMVALEARNSANDTLYASDLREIGKCASNNTRVHGLHIFRSGGYETICQPGWLDSVIMSWVLREIHVAEVYGAAAPLVHGPVLSSTVTRGSAYRVTSKVHGSVSKETVGDERLVFLEGFGICATFRSGDAVCSVLPMTLGLSPRATVCVRGSDIGPIIERYGIST